MSKLKMRNKRQKQFQDSKEKTCVCSYHPKSIFISPNDRSKTVRGVAKTKCISAVVRL